MLSNTAQFHSEHLGEHPNRDINISGIRFCRLMLQSKGLIGILKKGQWSGYEYGNISIRDNNSILISSSQTSGKADTDISDFAYVVDYDKKNFTVKWYGQKPPSSETPLHWFAYEASPESTSVIHGHSKEENKANEKVYGFFKDKGLQWTQSKSKSNKIGVELGNVIHS